MGKASGNLVRELSSKENIWLIFPQWKKMYPSDYKKYECTHAAIMHLIPRSFLILGRCLSLMFRIPCTGQKRTISLPADAWNLLSSAKLFQHHQDFRSRLHVSWETQAVLTKAMWRKAESLCCWRHLHGCSTDGGPSSWGKALPLVEA